jgi:hypothetical protein
MISMFPITQNINNAVLTAPRAMPCKDSTSDGTSTFAMGRQNFRASLVADTSVQSQNLQKKWIGGNRDASHIVNKRRIDGMAASLNSNGQNTSFLTKNDPNTVRDALVRTRHIGSAVPAKCIHKYQNPPVFY